jgi:hypothetical protein
LCYFRDAQLQFTLKKFKLPAMTVLNLFVAPTEEKGRGVFTEYALLANTVIEVAQAITFSEQDRQHIDKTILHDYIFEWGNEKKECAMALGLVPIYNHSYDSNCTYIMQYDTQEFIIQTVKDIEAGDELTINYNGEPTDTTPIWFETG